MGNFVQNTINFTVAEYTPTLVTNRVSTATQAKLLANKATYSINALEIDWNNAYGILGFTESSPLQNTGQLLKAIQTALDSKAASSHNHDSSYATKNHTHDLAIAVAASSDTNKITLQANTKYKLTAGNNTFIFTTPTDSVGSGADGNTTYNLTVNGTKNGSGTVSLGDIYAPLSSGNVGDLLMSNGNKNAPTWLSKGTANTILKVNSTGTGLTWATETNTWRPVYIGKDATTPTLTGATNSNPLRFDNGNQINVEWDSTNKVIKFNHFTPGGRSYGYTNDTPTPVFYKFSSDNWGHITKAEPVNKTDITKVLGDISATVTAETLKSLLVAGDNIAIKTYSEATAEEKAKYANLGFTDGKLIIINTYTPIDAFYKISVNKNGGNGTNYTMGPYIEGNIILLPDANTFTKSGSTLSSWNTLANGSGTTYATGSSFTVPDNRGTLTLYAQWTTNTINPTLTVNAPSSTSIADGGSTTITVTSNVSGKLQLTTYSGEGWAASSSSQNTNATNHTITITNKSEVTESGTISKDGIIAKFIPSSSSYNTLTGVSVLNTAITLLKKNNPTITVSKNNFSLASYNSNAQITTTAAEGADAAQTNWSLSSTTYAYLSKGIPSSASNTSLSSVTGSSSVYVVGKNTSSAPTAAGTFNISSLSPEITTGSSTTTISVSNVNNPTGTAAQNKDVTLTIANSTASTISPKSSITITIPGQAAQTATVSSYNWEATTNGTYVTLTNQKTSAVLVEGNNTTTSDKTVTIKCTVTWSNNKSSSQTIQLTVKPAVQTPTYYWYVGQSNPAEMTTISPIVTDTTSAGWRLIGTTLPTYSSSNKLYDAIARQSDNSHIVTGTSLATQWVAIPNESSACVRDGAGNDGSTVNICTRKDNQVLGGVEYKVYQWNSKAKKLGYDIY